MSIKISEAVNETLGANASKDKSVARVIRHSFPGGLSKIDSKKPAAFAYDNEEKTCANGSRIPRPPLMTSSSFNATLKNNQSEGKTKKPQSMIPRSRSRKRNENEELKIDIPSKTESLRNQTKDIKVSHNGKQHGDLADRKPGPLLPPYETPSKPFGLEMNEEKDTLRENLIKVSSLSLKSCQDFVELMKEASFEDAREDISSSFLADRKISRRDQELSAAHRSVKNAKDKELEAIRQERTIRHLYETLKCTFGPLLDNMKCINRERLHSNTTAAINNYMPAPDVLSVQGQYEFTLKEISNIWKNTISLMGSIKDHALKFVEGDNKSIDKEQLTLEAEMLQLALDFAISYSKLKTDFLIEFVRKRLNVKGPKKTELENFMDAKAFGALYSNDDLAAMARTVQDLNTSLLTSEDQVLE